jgi:FAD:protein FMN transferase
MLNRRRFIAISAALMAPLPAAAALHTETGQALGAKVTLRLAHPDAPAIAARAMAEIARLEDIFSLYREGSALMRLNAAGTLDTPPFELLECLSLAGAVHAASDGRFDPTVQPLWALHAAAAIAGQEVTPEALAAARAQVGWGRVTLDPARITLAPGMALTLNGIAQGYIADRVAALLEAEGLGNLLIDTGEFRALGGHPQGGGWPVKLAQGGTVALRGRALATSAPLGTTFDQAGRMGHILDPRSGRPVAGVWQAVSVSAPTAALADALSTAICLTGDEVEARSLCAAFRDVRMESLVEI